MPQLKNQQPIKKKLRKSRLLTNSKLLEERTTTPQPYETKQQEKRKHDLHC